MSGHARHLAVGALALGIAVATRPGRAEEPIEVTIVGDGADAIQRIPGTTTVIGKDEIERANPADAAELLRRIPGFAVRQDSAGGGRLDIGVRGLDPGRSRRLLVLEDGVPLAINPYAEPDIYFPIQIERVTSIEAIKGSGSILYGPQTIGGVVNFTTWSPPYRTESNASVEIGENGTVRQIGRFGTAISVGEDQSPVRVLSHIVVKGSDGPRDQPSRDFDAMAKVAFPTGARGEATLKLAAHRTRAVSEDVGLTRGMFDAAPDRPTISPESRLELTRLDAVYTQLFELTPAVSLKILGYGSYTARVWTRVLYDRIPDPQARYTRIVGDPDLPFGAVYFQDASRILDRAYWTAGLEPRLTARFDTAGVHHTLDAGLRVLAEGASLDERESAHAGAQAGELTASEGHRSFAFAAYAQDRLAFRPWLLVTPGVRLELARYDRDVELTAGGAPFGEGSSDVVGVVPGIGMTIGVPEIHGYGGVHLGFAPPRATAAIGAQGQSELLGAERSTIYEAGLRSTPVRGLALEGAFFFQRFENQIVPNTTLAGGTELVNGGATKSIGGEGSLRIEIMKLASLDQLALVDVGSRAGVLHATFDGGPNAGNTLPYAPAYTFSATLDVGAPTIGLVGELSYTRVGSQYSDDENTVLADASGRVGEIDAYDAVDVSLRYRVAKTGLYLMATGKSLLDRPYVASRRPEGIFTGGFRQLGFGVGYAP